MVRAGFPAIKLREVILVLIALIIGYFIPLNSFYSLAYALIALLIFSIPLSVYILLTAKYKLSQAIISALKQIHRVFALTAAYYAIVMGGILMLIVPGVYLLLKLTFSLQFLLLKKKRVYEALKSSFDYSSKYNKKLATYGFILLFIYFILLALPLGLGFTWLGIVAIYQIFATKLFVYGSKSEWNSRRKRNRV